LAVDLTEMHFATIGEFKTHEIQFPTNLIPSNIDDRLRKF